MLAHGTTGIMTDLHEVGVVSGLEGIEAILKEAETTDLKIYFVVPSHVPFPPIWKPAAAASIRRSSARRCSAGCGGPVGVRRSLYYGGVPRSAGVVDDTLSMPGKTLQGHLPDMYGPAMSACVAAGVSTDHESFCERTFLSGCATAAI